MNTLLELVAGILLAAGGVYFVLRPILTPAPVGGPPPDEAPVALDPEDDLSPRAVALRALKEIEFDRATGKLADGDYEALNRKYTTAALEALRAEEAPPPVSPPAPVPAPRAAAAATKVCPQHGARPERDATFCSVCGERLAAASGFCSSCGTALQPEAKFCARCGDQVAA